MKYLSYTMEALILWGRMDKKVAITLVLKSHILNHLWCYKKIDISREFRRHVQLLTLFSGKVYCKSIHMFNKLKRSIAFSLFEVFIQPKNYYAKSFQLEQATKSVVAIRQPNELDSIVLPDVFEFFDYLLVM